jgi:hypothetical protein
MCSGFHGCALAPLVGRGRCCLWWLFSCGAFLGAFSPCLVFGGVVGGSVAFRGFFRACRVRGACLCFAFRVAFGFLAPVLALFRLVFAFGVFSIGQKEKAVKIGFKMACYVFVLRDVWQDEKKGGIFSPSFYLLFFAVVAKKLNINANINIIAIFKPF